MPFSGDTFTHLFSWDQDPQRQEKIINARLEAEFDGLDTGLSALAADITTVEGNVRTKLSAARTYYVRTDGSDSNTGLVDSAGGAFLTIQKAINVISETLDIGGQTVTVQVKDGTYTGANTLKNVVGFGGAGGLVIQGNNATPANVDIHVTSGACFSASNLYSIWDIKDLKVRTTTGGNCIDASNAVVRWSNLNFAACAGTHLGATKHSQIAKISGNYTISGGAATAHAFAANQSIIDINSNTVTLSGTPAFAIFIWAQGLALVEAQNVTWSGSATGIKYRIQLNSALNSNGGLALIPGDATEAPSTGGQVL